jgi:hypothetical protein
VGLLNDNTLRDELLNKKNKSDKTNKTTRFELSESDINSCLDKFKKFVTRIYKMKEQLEFNKLNEYFLLVLLRIYLDEKDNLNLCLENLSKFENYMTDEYYDKLFIKTINKKKTKIINGKYLEKPFDEIKEKLKKCGESEDNSESENEDVDEDENNKE